LSGHAARRHDRVRFFFLVLVVLRVGVVEDVARSARDADVLQGVIIRIHFYSTTGVGRSSR
jgi:hypothetical protein